MARLEAPGTSGRYRLGIAMSLLAALFVGIMPNAAKMAYHNGANPMALLLVRTAIGAIGMALFLRLGRNPLSVPRKYVKLTALAGIAMFLAAGGGMSAVAYIDVSLASVLIFTYPFFVAVVNHFRGQTRIGPIDLLLIAIAFCGLALTLGISVDSLNATGVALALTSSLGIAIMVLATTDTSRALGTVRANLHMTVWAGVYFALLALAGPGLGATDSLRLPTTSAGWGYMVLAGLSFTLGYLFFFVAATILGSTRASILSILEPVMMILIALALVGERLQPLQWLGVVAVFGGILATEILAVRRTQH